MFGLLVMDEAGKAKAQTDLNTLDADGQTNLWEGLYMGLEILRKEGSANRLSTVLLLTDGQPNISPSKGHITMLQEYRKQYPSMLCTINTFGFGYNLDSVLLRDLCMEGDGMYTFIPDAGFVGKSKNAKFVGTPLLVRHVFCEHYEQHPRHFGPQSLPRD